ncbi:hypothetical protein Syun_019779 [Stephania yunnanensis]|uniref:Uncharacterized protein n=1 Tax=Stephania yunnanensis TaxID=152371 RepID=A0AAP0IWQ5_9MAGN
MEGLPSRIERVHALGFGGLAQTFSHSKRGGYWGYLRRSPVGGLRRLVPGRGAQKRRAVLGPPRYGEATGSIMPVAGVQPKGLSPERGGEEGTVRSKDANMMWTVRTLVHEFDDSGSKATPRKRLVKKSGDEREDARFWD